MPVSFGAIFGGLVLPFVVAAVLVSTFRKACDNPRGSAIINSALGLSWLVGYAALQLAPWSPTSHWHWIVYAVLLAALIAAVCDGLQLPTWLRATFYLVVAAVSAWMLVPTWQDLQPSRPTLVISTTIVVTSLSIALSHISTRVPSSLLMIAICAALFAACLLLFLSGSLRFAQITCIGTAGIAGVGWLAMTNKEKPVQLDVGLFFATLCACMLMVGRVNSYSDIPDFAYLLVPVAPTTVALWCFPYVAKRSQAWRAAISLACPLLVLAIAIGVAVLFDLILESPT